MDAEKSLDKASLSVNLSLIGIMTIGSTLGFLYFTALFFFTKQPIGGVFFLILASFSIYIFFGAYGKIEMNKKFITYKTFTSNYRIYWDEVKRIEWDPYPYGSIVFIGENKQLAIPKKFYWSGKDKKEMASLITIQTEENNITLRGNSYSSAFFASSKNSRIARSGDVSITPVISGVIGVFVGSIFSFLHEIIFPHSDLTGICFIPFLLAGILASLMGGDIGEKSGRQYLGAFLGVLLVQTMYLVLMYVINSIPPK